MVKKLAIKLQKHFVESLLDYDPATGIFLWKVDHGRSRFGSVAGTVVDGYVRINIEGASYYAHRLAWLLVTGDWPTNRIDHMDGDRANNRIANLRDVSHATNMQNFRRPRVDNKSTGVLGVGLHRESGRFFASISVNGKTRRLGYRDSLEDAERLYLEAKRKLHEGCTL